MVPGFSRSHARTSSLPCTTHPLVSHLEVELQAVRSWLVHSHRDSSLAAGLQHIDELISTVEELLNLPESRDFFCHAECTDKLLDDLLCLADIYGSVRSAAIMLRQNHAELHSALRRRDPTWLAASVRTQRHIEKEITQLAAAVRHVASSGDSSDIEIGTVVREAVTVSALASVDLLSKVVLTSSSAASASSAMVAVGSSKVSLMEGLFKKKCSEEEKELMAVEKLQVLEECIMELEWGSERVFRSLAKARVSLLNIVTLSF